MCLITPRVKIKPAVLQGVIASGSEPGQIFFSFDPQTHPGIKIPTLSDPLEKNAQQR